METVRVWKMLRLSAQISPIDDVGIDYHRMPRSRQPQVIQVEAVQGKRCRIRFRAANQMQAVGNTAN